MLVDDEEEMVTLYKEFLTHVGFKVDSFTDPQLALENFKQSSDKYFMVLTDLRMPSLSGIDLACKIREINENVVINLITAFNVDDDMRKNERYRSANIQKILQKPIRLSTLKEEIQSCL